MKKFKFNYNVVLVLLVISALFMIGMAYLLEINSHEGSADNLFWFAIVLFIFMGSVLTVCTVIDLMEYMIKSNKDVECSVCSSTENVAKLKSVDKALCGKCFDNLKEAL